jgi:hypothetical protein
MVLSVIAGMALQFLVQNQADTVKPTDKHQYIKTQYAGNIGFVSIGTGYEYKKASIDLSYGYLPKLVNGVRVHTLSLRPKVHFGQFVVSQVKAGFYFGAGINYSFGRNIYGEIPNYFTFDYYWPNAFRLNPFLGGRIGFNSKNQKDKKIYLYSELGTLEYKIWYAMQNKKSIKPYEIWDICFGLTMPLTK